MPGRLPRRQKPNRKLSHHSSLPALLANIRDLCEKSCSPCSSVPPRGSSFSFATCAAKAVPSCSSVPPWFQLFLASFATCAAKAVPRVPPCPPWSQLFLASFATCAAKAVPRVPRAPWSQLFLPSFATCAAKAVSPCSSVPPVVPAFPSVPSRPLPQTSLTSHDQKLATSYQFHA